MDKSLAGFADKVKKEERAKMTTEKQKMLDLLIELEKRQSSLEVPYSNFYCIIAGEIERDTYPDKNTTEALEGYKRKKKEFLEFIYDTKGIKVSEELTPNAGIPFHIAFADAGERIVDQKIEFLRAIWLDFMILVLEDEVLELMEAESPREEVPEVPEDMPVPKGLS